MYIGMGLSTLLSSSRLYIFLVVIVVMALTATAAKTSAGASDNSGKRAAMRPCRADECKESGASTRS